MFNIARCEAFLINLIAKDGNATMASNLKNVFAKFLTDTDTELVNFITEIDKLFPTTDNGPKNHADITASILAGLGISKNPSAEQKQFIISSLNKLLVILTKKITHLNKIKTSLTADIKKAFADYRTKNGLIKFLKFINSNQLQINAYLLEHLPSTYAKEDLIAQLSDPKFLMPIITDSIGELISGKTINYSENELDKLTGAVNEYFLQDFSQPEEADQAIVDFTRDNHLKAYDSALITKHQDPNSVKEAVMAYTENDEILANNILTRGGQAQSANITLELAARVQLNKQPCSLGSIQDELLYLKDEQTNKKYIQIKQNIYVIADGIKFYALGTDGALVSISAQEANEIQKMIAAGILPSRKPILQAIMRIDMHTENNKPKYKVTEFSVTINTKDITYDYQSSSKPNPLHRAKPAPKTLDYTQKSLTYLGKHISDYANRKIVTNPGESIRDFNRHNYIKGEEFATKNSNDNKTIINTVKRFAPNEVIANAMLSCGGQTLQSYILTELKHRYIYNGVPLGISLGIKTHITYTKTDNKVSAEILLTTYLVEINEKFYAASETGQLEEISEEEALQLQDNINKDQPVTRQPILESIFNLDIEQADNQAKYTVKQFSTELKIANPAITMRPSALSQDYERLRRKITRLNDKISILEKQPDNKQKQQDIQKLSEKKIVIEKQQQQIDRENFNALYYYSDGQDDKNSKITQLGVLQARRIKQEEDALKLRKISLKNQLINLTQQKQQKIAVMANELTPYRQQLYDMLLDQIAPAFNKALTLMTGPEKLLAKRLTAEFNEPAFERLKTNIKAQLLTPDTPFNINFLDKDNLGKFLAVIDNNIELINAELKNNKTNKLERMAHSAINALDNNSGRLLGSQHNRIQYSKNLKNLRKQLQAAKEQLQASDYYCSKNNPIIEEGNYTDAKAISLQSKIKKMINSNPDIDKLNKAIATTQAQLDANSRELNKLAPKYTAKLKEIDELEMYTKLSQ